MTSPHSIFFFFLHKNEYCQLISRVCLIRQEAWKHAIEKAKAMPDPWAQFHLEDIKTETCVRYRYE